MATHHPEKEYSPDDRVSVPPWTVLFPEMATPEMRALVDSARAEPVVSPGGLSYRDFLKNLWNREGWRGFFSPSHPDVDSLPIVRLANYILSKAIELGASEIHQEALQRNLIIRLRIDGLLYEGVPLPKPLQSALISRYKTMGSMNLTEQNVPQEGHIPIRHSERHYDIHVSSLPSQYGERLAMRIVSQARMQSGFVQLGFTPAMRAQLEALLEQSQGMLLVTGPAGSGTLQTVYSMLTKLNSVQRNILSIEDPIETVLPGITQVGVDRQNGLTLASGLRAILRQSPDVVMVSELRDRETVEVAIETALTGRLVLSTMSASDGPAALLRLIDLGVRPSQLPQAVVGVLAQRQVRRICSACKESYTATGSDLRRLGFPQLEAEQEVTLYRGRGCDQCLGSGYHGLIGIYELMEVNVSVAAAVAAGAPLTEIRTAARLAGMEAMWEDGMLKALQGLTTPEEVRRAINDPPAQRGR